MTRPRPARRPLSVSLASGEPTASPSPRRSTAPSGSPSRVGVPRPFDRLAPDTSVADALADAPGSVRYCAAGKVAIRAALGALDARPGDNLLLPAAVPHAVVEPLRERGVEPRYHRVDPSLGADVDHLADRIDDRTVAVMLVHYFGFPNPTADAVRSAAAEAGVPVVENNSHGALSAPGGRLLGTDGPLGFTSLHKTLPVPDGAVLYADGPTPDDPLCAVADRLSLRDARFLAGAVVSRTPGAGALVDRLRSGEESADATDGTADGRTPSPETSRATYEATKRPMSWLAARLLGVLDPASVVARRRAGFDRWAMALDDSPLYDLEPGVCPWAFPVRVDDAPALSRAVPGSFAWPRLPRDVAGDASYPVANETARSLLALPVGRPGTVARLASAVE